MTRYVVGAIGNLPPVMSEGRAEITKVVNGEERVIGVRKPGQFFGEVPMTLSDADGPGAAERGASR